MEVRIESSGYLDTTVYIDGKRVEGLQSVTFHADCDSLPTIEVKQCIYTSNFDKRNPR